MAWVVVALTAVTRDAHDEREPGEEAESQLPALPWVDRWSPDVATMQAREDDN